MVCVRMEGLARMFRAYMRTTHHVRHCCAQNADHLAHGSPLSAFFAEVVCSLAATPPPVGAWPTPNGGNGVIRGTTRRRHAASHLLMLPNPHCHRCGERRRDVMGLAAVSVGGGRSTTGGAGGAEVRQYSPPRTAPGRCRYKIRPADPFSPDLRYKTLPARSRSPYLARFARAGRTLYRCHQQEAVRGELCTACEAETALAITAHHGPRAWRARRARLRCPWAVAGPGRASRRRAERSSRRGRLAGGPPPTGT